MSGIDNLMESLVKNAERIVALRTERDELRRVLADFIELFPVPERNCGCHVCPPCSDCVDYSAQRETIAEARKLLRGDA